MIWWGRRDQLEKPGRHRDITADDTTAMKVVPLRPVAPIRRATDRYIAAQAWGVVVLGVVLVARLARAGDVWLAVSAMVGVALVGTCAIGMTMLLFEKWGRS